MHLPKASGAGVVLLELLLTPVGSDADAHLKALQDKLNACVAFIESGQMAQTYPDKSWSKVAIDVYPLREYDAR